MHRIFVDSNVLGSKTQYDWLFMLRNETQVMFTLHTSGDVLDEAHRVWRKRKPNLGSVMRQEREQRFRESFDDVLDEWEGGIAPTINDVHDTHVHNAAVSGNVDILLTNNVSDFGNPEELPYDLYTPDEFFSLIFENDPQAVRQVTRDQAKYWAMRQEKDPQKPKKKLFEALVDAGCPGFAETIEECLKFVSGVTLATGTAPSDAATQLAPTTS